ncbi:PIN domain-containing protein [Candidatus Woesearchaeota archaeon]|nr:PIN domain-containing protein [Candidatus Woesearchaeota archaeon]
MKVLDTTFLIDFLKGKKETLKIIKSKEDLLTTQINMYEVIRGAFLRDNPSELLKAEQLFENIKVLQIDDDAVIRSADIFSDLVKNGKMVPDSDCMTAGTALSKGVNKIVTRNKEHFKRMKGIKVETY